MTLQNHFNIKRFSNYFKYNLTMYGKSYLYFSIGLLIALFSINFFTLSTATISIRFLKGYYIPVFFMIYTISCVIAVGTSFPSLRNSNKISNYLLIPVSTFEKMLLEFMIRIIGFNLLFIPLYWLVFKIAYAVYHLFEWNNPIVIGSFDIFSPFYALTNALDKFAVILSILSLSSFLFMGAAYFKKNALFKTIFTLSILVVFFFVLMVGFSHLFLPNKVEGIDIEILSRRINKDLWNTQLYAYIIGIGSSLFFIPLTYFKLKEKHV